MKMIDLTEEAAKVFESDMSVDTLLIKLNLEVHKQRVLEMDKILNDILKLYDNPLEVKTIITGKLSENSKDLKDRGLGYQFKLDLV